MKENSIIALSLSYFGGLESIILETLNLIKFSEARIKVRKNLCGFLPATIELKSENWGNFSLNFGDFEPLEAPVIIQYDLFQSDFSNPIDLCRINSVILDEGLQSDGLPDTWIFSNRMPHPSQEILSKHLGSWVMKKKTLFDRKEFQPLNPRWKK